MKMKALALAGIGSIALVGAANAAFTHASLVDVSGSVGTPAGFSTYRVLLHFDNPGDSIVAVGSGTADGVHYPFTLETPGGLHNGDGKFAGEHLADVPGAGIFGQETWDSWLTIMQNLNQFPNPAQFSPGFIDDSFDQTNNPIQLLTDGFTGVVEDNGGWGQAPAVVNPSGHVIAQITVPSGTFFNMSGVVTWNGADGSIANKSFFVLVFDPAPGALPLLGLAALAGTRRRRG